MIIVLKILALIVVCALLFKLIADKDFLDNDL